VIRQPAEEGGREQAHHGEGRDQDGDDHRRRAERPGVEGQAGNHDAEAGHVDEGDEEEGDQGSSGGCVQGIGILVGNRRVGRVVIGNKEGLYGAVYDIMWKLLCRTTMSAPIFSSKATPYHVL
jgi:hypothetical protein